MNSVSIAIIAIAVAALASAGLYARKRQWLQALLVLVAGASLGASIGGVTVPGRAAPDLVVLTDGAATAAAAASAGTVIDLRGAASSPAALADAWSRAAAVTVLGDGLDEAQLRDLPARALRWSPPASGLLRLDFPRDLALGRPFTLTARYSQAVAGWRLQLLAENGQVIAEQAAAGASVSVQWMPPVAEAMVLQARLLDAAGKTVAAGPVPLNVHAATPLQVLGRFDAPSFDVRTLNQLLADSGALIDQQVTLGKALVRSETARAPLAAPNLIVADAAYVEHLSAGARAALLAQVGAGLPLLVLAGDEADNALWAREFALSALHTPAAGADASRQFSMGGTALALTAAPSPGDSDKVWSVLARDGRQQPWLWQRDWQKGRIVWLGAADWHRYAIDAPQALGLWWQGALDLAAAGSKDKLHWSPGDAMPVVGLRSAICGRGAAPGATVQIDGLAPAPWLARADQADAACVAVWPRQAGWLKLAAGGADGRLYVYGRDDWPAWQRALRRDAMAAYAARLPDVASADGPAPASAPAWPFELVFAAGMLLLWWRERR